MSDVIYRQDAIDAVSELLKGIFVEHDDIAKVALNNVSSAESEIIRCKDCKHHHYDSKDIPYCDRINYGYGWKDNDFCSRAERRKND